MSEPVSRRVRASGVARHCGVTRQAVANWVTRGVLPPDLRPPYLDSSSQWTQAPLWDESQLDGLKAWQRQGSRRKPRARKAPADAPGKFTVEISYGFSDNGSTTWTWKGTGVEAPSSKAALVVAALELVKARGFVIRNAASVREEQ